MRVRYTAIDVIWREYTEAVQNELKEMLQIEEINLSNPAVFQQRTAAAKQVLKNMTAGEREEIYAKVEHYKCMGLPEDTQRQ